MHSALEMEKEAEKQCPREGVSLTRSVDRDVLKVRKVEDVDRLLLIMACQSCEIPRLKWEIL
jgi:hypothetical protein